MSSRLSLAVLDTPFPTRMGSRLPLADTGQLSPTSLGTSNHTTDHFGLPPFLDLCLSYAMAARHSISEQIRVSLEKYSTGGTATLSLGLTSCLRTTTFLSGSSTEHAGTIRFPDVSEHAISAPEVVYLLN